MDEKKLREVAGLNEAKAVDLTKLNKALNTVIKELEAVLPELRVAIAQPGRTDLLINNLKVFRDFSKNRKLKKEG